MPTLSSRVKNCSLNFVLLAIKRFKKKNANFIRFNANQQIKTGASFILLRACVRSSTENLRTNTVKKYNEPVVQIQSKYLNNDCNLACD